MLDLPPQIEAHLNALGVLPRKEPAPEKVATVAATPWKPEFKGQEPPF